MTIFGHLNTWLLIALAWLGSAIVCSIIFSLLASVERRIAKRREGK